jgi:hypothetical protein
MFESISNTNITPAQKPEMLSPDQIRRIRRLWDTKTIKEIAVEVGALEDTVSNFAKTHYLYFKYLR